MGKKDKKRHKHRSRSRSREKYREKKRHERSRSCSSNSSDTGSSYSRSHSHRHKRKKTHNRSPSSSSESDHSDRRSKPSANKKESDGKCAPVTMSKEERRKQKELMKALETPEEKRARRLAKKEAKERKRKQKSGWDNDYISYTNADNPFGDEHLLETFVWTKKMEDEKCSQIQVPVQDRQRQQMEESRKELEKVKRRRLEREREMAERENEREMLQRDKELEYFREWEKQEDHFHLNQAKLRSKIRIDDGRAKPIDLLANYISAEDDELAVEMHEPYTYLYGLTATDLEDLLEDIKVYLELEQGKNVDYWKDIIIITEDELQKLRKLDPSNRVFAGDRRGGINEAVTDEVSSIFTGKTTNQLFMLEKQIKEKLKGGEGVDVGYWECLLQQLKAHLAKTRLKERHQDVLRKKLFSLKQEQGIETGPLFPVLKEEKPQTPSRSEDDDAQPTTSGESQPTDVMNSENNDSQDEQFEEVLEEEDVIDQCEIDYEAGLYSPKLLKTKDLDIDAVVYEVGDDMKKLELARLQVQSTGRVNLDNETEFEKKAREGMNDDEAQFSVQFQLDKQTFLWSDKYRPRKPRFFNRVHTGFEWNKYNQTHYDIDNPPPKIVQGYKFNIFYPDLIDKTETPEYIVTPIENDKDFGILKFHAGPPYEDIAFKVVNREWEYSYKRGFRCQYQNGIFQLWFHFKRYRYRR